MSQRERPLALLDPQQLAPLWEVLAEHGLVLASIVNVASLPPEIWLAETTSRQQGALLLLGHGGRLFWEQYRRDAALNIADPVDNYSATVSERALRQYLPAFSYERLFPLTDCPVNLMALGRVLGWHTPSPLGMGINARYGLWSAYRALWWLDAELATVSDETGHPVAYPPIAVSANASAAPDICGQCATQACIAACPAQAVAAAALPNLQRCADYRLTAQSACAETCLARMACPVMPAQRYTAAQMAYHYDLTRSQIHLFSSRAAADKRSGHVSAAAQTMDAGASTPEANYD